MMNASKKLKQIGVLAIACVLAALSIFIAPPRGVKVEASLQDHAYYDEPITQYSGNLVEYVQRINRVTGTTALTDTTKLPRLTSKNGPNDILGCTDLGIPYQYKDELHIVFGDTFSGKVPGQGNWFSNAILVTKDWDFSDGLEIIDGGVIIEPVPSLHSDHHEMTTIPTGVVVIGETIYLYYMAIRNWGTHGIWHINYSGVYKSTDGRNFSSVPSMWHYTNIFSTFGQVQPLLVGDTVYLYGLPGGRSGGLRCAKVPASQIEDMSKYRYFDGYNDDGVPQWIPYDAEYMAFWSNDMDVEVLGAPCAEMSIAYSPYLDQYIATYSNGDMVIRTADDPWGPFSEPEVLLTQNEYPAFYNGFTNECMMSDDGKSIYFFMSQWPNQGAGTTNPDPAKNEDYFVSMFKIQLK